MGSSLSAIADDMNDYSYLCKKYNSPMDDLYSVHYNWINDFHDKRTTLSFSEYKKLNDKAELKRKISNLKQEITKKQEELKKLELEDENSN